MNRVVFGKTGEAVSEMCLGTMMFGDRCDETETNRIVSAAIDAGVNFIDTAAMYCDGYTEEILGRVLAGRREKVFITTKVHTGVNYETITTSINGSLKRLQTDCVDLYLIHWPRVGMCVEEVMRALNDVVRAGKARFVGCSNYSAWLFAHSNALARANGWAELMSNQVPYNPVERGIEVEILPQAIAENVAITIYRPLVRGLLTGKYRPGEKMPAGSRGEKDERFCEWLEKFADGVRYLLNLAENKEISPAQIAVAWLRASPGVTCPIVGLSRFEQLADSLGAFTVNLTPEERVALSDAFGAEVKEEAGGEFPNLRRELNLTRK